MSAMYGSYVGNAHVVLAVPLLRHRCTLGRTQIFALCVALLLPYLASCRPGASSTPGQVVEAAFMAANEGRYSEAEAYLTPDLFQSLQSTMQMPGGVQGIWDSLTMNGNIAGIRLISEEIRGEGAIVRFYIDFAGGPSGEHGVRLTHYDGTWKLSSLWLSD